MMNEVEWMEKRGDSQLLKDIVIALPDDKELDLQDRINITHEIIDEMGWIKDGLAVQVDIHQPHDGENNWHAHLLVSTRKFTECGKFFSPKKARDLNPDFKTANGKSFIIPEEDIIHEKGKRIINNYFKKLGLENRVDMISTVPQEHIGPVRMRRFLNFGIQRNESRLATHLENVKNGDQVLDRITRQQSVFSKYDIEKAVKDIPDLAVRKRLIAEALASKRLVPLHLSIDNVPINEKVDKTPYYTTKEVRFEKERIIRIATKIKERNNHSRTPATALAIKDYVKEDKVSQAQRLSLETRI